jgi:ribosomal protein S18 acetylase RimI-like enzyme
VTARRELAARLQRNEASSFNGAMVSDPFSRRRFGFTVARRSGLVLLGSTRLAVPLFHRAIGFGISAPADGVTVRSILRHYARLGADARVEVAEGIAPRDSARVLERDGFRRENEVHIVHVRTAERPPEVRRVRGLSVDTVRQRDARLFGRLARIGFEESGDRGLFVERSTAFVLRRGTPGRFVGYIGRIDGEPAATGLVCLTKGVGGLYSDSTHPDFRGRGIQKAMIRARIERGLRRGQRVFTARTEGANTSARNYEQTGFVPLYRASFWVRRTDR